MATGEIALLTQISSLGLGAVIATIVLMWKRSDDQAHKSELVAIIARLEAHTERELKAIETTAITLQAIQKAIESFVTLSRLEERIMGLERGFTDERRR